MIIKHLNLLKDGDIIFLSLYIEIILKLNLEKYLERYLKINKQIFINFYF